MKAINEEGQFIPLFKKDRGDFGKDDFYKHLQNRRIHSKNGLNYI